MISQESRHKLQTLFFDGVTPAGTPELHAMAGIPAAGKTTFITNGLQNGSLPKNAFMLAPDRVMEALPEYQEDFKINGAVHAFQKWELPARHLAYDFFEDAFHKRFNIIIDMGHVRMEDYERLEKLKKAGYRIHIYHIECAPEEAVRRVKTRTRHTPDRMIYERSAALAKLLPRYKTLADRFVTV